MTMDARLYVQLGTGDHPIRGELLYSGPVDLYWDSESSLSKNKGIIPGEKLKLDRKSSETYAVLDVVLHTPWGDLDNTVANVELRG
jgi:hypothetical protein